MIINGSEEDVKRQQEAMVERRAQARLAKVRAVVRTHSVVDRVFLSFPRGRERLSVRLKSHLLPVRALPVPHLL